MKTTPSSKLTTQVTTSKMNIPVVRLVNGRLETEGRIELLHDGKWGTVCDDDFDNLDGDVICKMLGYRGANRVFGTAHFSNGYGPIWQDNLHCIGNETDIGDCLSNGWGNTDCGHGEDAGVSCDPYSFGHFSSFQRTTVGNPCVLTSTPCLNGGTCIVNANYGYTCQCAQGFGGPYCRNGLARTTPKDACHNNPCQNGGTCYQTSPQDGYHCLCSNGYTGNSCETIDIDPKSIVSVGCLDSAWNITVHIPSLQAKYPDFNPSECYIGVDNVNCTGQVNGSYLYFRHDYSECNTKEKNSTEGVEYRSELVCPRHDRLYHFIIREIRLRKNLLCKFFSINSASSTLRDRLVHLQFFSDPSLSRSKNFHSSKVGEKLYVRAFSDVTDSTLKMRLSHCYTTPAIVTDSKMQYFIIRNGCVIDPNAVIFYQSAHETRFSFEYFEFTTSHDSMNLYCNATFCQSNDHSPACQPTCHAHVIRRLKGDKDEIDLSDEDGTFQVDMDNKQVAKVKSKKTTDLTPATVISVIIGVCVLTLLVIAVAVKTKRSKNILKL
ncbi:deleted in malignant brain tumors 1 protein-like [Saccostrea echinata]|uniref:deleted in malignant brain tumors 1 protein-like n=1 Tax=Saccostrea echinata TaxID=191078 RepID=UPI002A808742|nr:deleted in malignant brain tumors 1 protein-like [Saccostrea echinata]